MIDPIEESVFPLVYSDDNERFHVAGTAILVEHANVSLLVTAAHILRDIGNKYLLRLLWNNKAIVLSGPAFISKEPSESSPLDLDIAVFPLSLQTDLMEHLNGTKTITLKDFDDSVGSARSHYFVFGFPWRKAFYSKEINELSAKPLRYFTDLITDAAVYSTYNKSPEAHIIVHYNPKKTMNQERKPITAPKPHGISGGPLFRALVDDKDNLIMLILEGLLTDWKDKKIIVATKKNEIRKFIEASDIFSRNPLTVGDLLHWEDPARRLS